LGKTRTKVAVEKSTVTLTNGAIIEARVARSTLSYLRFLLDTSTNPPGQELIEDLHHIAQGKPDEARSTSREVLARDVLVSSPDGELFNHVRDLMLCAFHRSPDGIVLIEPYAATDANRDAIDAADIEFRDLMRKTFGPGAGGSGGRSDR